jgi:hypothetical protein
MSQERLSLTMTKADLARELRVSVRTIERMRRAGFLPPMLPGFTRPRFSSAAVVAWLHECAERKRAAQ